MDGQLESRTKRSILLKAIAKNLNVDIKKPIANEVSNAFDKLFVGLFEEFGPSITL